LDDLEIRVEIWLNGEVESHYARRLEYFLTPW
jgi:hypothetical protein